MDEFVFHWIGDHLSLNELYSQKHWSSRKKLADKWHKKFGKMLLEYDKPEINEYRVKLVYKSRLDVDNTVALVKMFVDTLRKQNWVKDDSPKYLKEVRLNFDNNLETKEYLITLVKIS